MRAIQSLAISSDGLHLYAASDGSGVFRLDLNGQPPAAASTPTSILATTAPTSMPASTAEIVPAIATLAPTEETPVEENQGSRLPCLGSLILPLLAYGITRLKWRR
jgi:hypothetical protein